MSYHLLHSLGESSHRSPLSKECQRVCGHVLKLSQYSVNYRIAQGQWSRDGPHKKRKIKGCNVCLISPGIIGSGVAKFDRLVLSVLK